MRALSKVALLMTALGLSQPVFSEDYFVDLSIGVASADADNALNRGTNAVNGPPSGFDIDADTVYGIGIGYQINKQFAVALEYKTREFEPDSSPLPSNPNGGLPGNNFDVTGQVDAATWMITGRYDFEPISSAKPYIKLGLGYADLDTEATLFISPLFDSFVANGGDLVGFGSGCAGVPRFCYPDGSDSEFAWSLGAGVAFDVSKNVAVALDYQYVSLGDTATSVDPNGDSLGFDSLAAHEFSAVFQYRF